MAYDPDIAITLWPEYFDINRTRSEGRRLPKELCVSNPCPIQTWTSSPRAR